MDEVYRINVCTCDAGGSWERSSSTVAVGEADAEAEWERVVGALTPEPYEQCVTLVADERVVREYTQDAVDVLRLAVDRLRGERVGDVVVYYDDGSQMYYVCDLPDARELGERLLDDVDGTAYSRWCAETTPLGEGDTFDGALEAAEAER